MSSTGHLLVVQRLLGIEASEAANAFAVIQGGAIAAVLLLYHRRVGQMFLGLAGREAAGRRLLVGLVVAFLPAGPRALPPRSASSNTCSGRGPLSLPGRSAGRSSSGSRRASGSARAARIEDVTWRMAASSGSPSARRCGRA